MSDKTQKPLEKQATASITELAALMGKNWKTVSNYLAEPDAPKPAVGGRNKRWVIAEAKAYIDANSRGEVDDESLTALKKKRLAGQIARDATSHEREKILLESTRGKFFPKEQVIAEDAQIHATIKAVLQRKFAELPPRFHGMSVPDMTEEFRLVLLEICRLFRDRNTWQQSTPTESTQ